MKIIFKKNPLRKVHKINRECPNCKCELTFIEDGVKQIMEKFDSMEGTIYKCNKCGRYFADYEKNDYDYFVLREIDIE